MIIRCSAILFDLDGTLIDSVAAVDRAWAKWAVRVGRDPAEVVPYIHGRRAMDSLRLLAPEMDAEGEFAWLRGVESVDTEGIVPIAGAMALLDSLPPDRWCVVTSGTSDVANARMIAGGIRPVIAVCGEDVNNGKPAPDPFLLGASRLGFKPETCLVFEDTAAGIQGGIAAGMKTVGVTNGKERPDLGIANAVIRDFWSIRARWFDGDLTIEITD